MAFYKQITQQVPDRITQPPEDGRDIMVKLKDLGSIYVALNHPNEMGGSITVLGLGYACRRPWTDVAAWWPVPSEEDLQFVEWRQHIGNFLDALKDGNVTCIGCSENMTCTYRWDFYNTKGVCLRVK